MPGSWLVTWMEVAEVISYRSGCDRAQVGAVAVGPDNRYVVVGYNGRAAADTQVCPRELGAPKEECTAIHAEVNLLLQADRSRIAGGTVFVTRTPCMNPCALALGNSGVATVVYRITDADDKARHPAVAKYLERLGIRVIVLD